MEFHVHNSLEIIYCRSGVVEIDFLSESPTGKKSRSKVILTSKQFVVIDVGVFHKICYKSNEKAVVIDIEWKLVPYKEYDPPLSSLVSVDFKAFFDKFDGLKYFANNSEPYLVALDSGNLEHCLVYYIELLASKQKDLSNECYRLARSFQILMELDKCLTPSNFSTGITYIKKAQDFIKNNFNRDISVSEIAENAGVNKAYLQRLFKNYVGMSVLQSLNNFRIEKCKRILIETNLTIDEICNHVGFHNRQHLIYEFKAQTGIAPSVYRSKHLETISFKQNPKDHYITITEHRAKINANDTNKEKSDNNENK